MIEDKKVEELLRYVAEQRLKGAPVNKQAVLNILDIQEPEPETNEFPDFEIRGAMSNQQRLSSLGQSASGLSKFAIPAIGIGIGAWLFMRNK